jgi:hypothetical protein
MLGKLLPMEWYNVDSGIEDKNSPRQKKMLNEYLAKLRVQHAQDSGA